MTEVRKNTNAEEQNASETTVPLEFGQALRSPFGIWIYWILLFICGFTGLSLIYYRVMAGPITVSLIASFLAQAAVVLLIFQLNFLRNKASWTLLCRLIFIGAGLCALTLGVSYLLEFGSNSWAMIVLCILTGASTITVAIHKQIYRTYWHFAILVAVSLATGVLGFILGLTNEQDFAPLPGLYVFQWATIVGIWQSKLADVKFDAILTRIWLIVYICAAMIVLFWGVNSLLTTNDDSVVVCVHMALNVLGALFAIAVIIAQKKADAWLQDPVPI